MSVDTYDGGRGRQIFKIQVPYQRLSQACCCGSCEYWNQVQHPHGECRRQPPVIGEPRFPSVDCTEWCGQWEFVQSYREDFLLHYMNKDWAKRANFALEVPPYHFGIRGQYFSYKAFWTYGYHLLMFLWDYETRGEFLALKGSSLHYWTGIPFPVRGWKRFEPKNVDETAMQDRAMIMLQPEILKFLFPQFFEEPERAISDSEEG